MMKKITLCFALCSLFSAALHAGTAEAEKAVDQRPNILLLVVDDLAYTDLGAFGGEIKTPNLDALAREGMRFTQFYAAPTCSPTRAMLLTGVDSHKVGLGNMAEELAPNQKGKPGYEGYLNERAAPLPGLLQQAGYRTLMSGKWHLGLEEDNSPAARGFDQSFALLQGGAGHFDDLALVGPGKALYRENGKSASLPEDFYSSRFFTDTLIDYLDEGKGESRKPFFAYLSYSAPHWPLHAPQSSIARYKGLYDKGFAALAQARKNAAVEEGVLDERVPAWQLPEGESDWSQLTQAQRKRSARLMEIYAAMVDDIDRNVGRLLGHLKKINELDNTLIVFLSDNGPEGHHLEQGWPELSAWVAECCDNTFANMGNADSYLWLGPQWGAATAGGNRYYKGYVNEGGIRVPAFVYHKNRVKTGISDAFVSVKDIVPTVLGLAGVDQAPSSYKGKAVFKPEGRSLLPLLTGASTTVHGEEILAGWELFGKRALRQNDWKLVWQPKPVGAGQWQLFNLAQDPAEQRDLATQMPEKLKEMQVLWQEYVAENGVILPDWVSGY
jgi:arylsulfatase